MPKKKFPNVNILKGSITSINSALYYIPNRFDNIKLISSTLTPTTPLTPLANPLSYSKLVSGNLTSSNTLGNLKRNYSADIAYSSLVRDGLANSFSLAGFGTSA
jgi:hypothetical protein